ncbi:MAG: TAXI family TRAP transporter solute-binding subunit, partial [Alphaproteobacteria bacterium]
MQMLRIGGLAALIVLAGFVLAYQFVEPAPPNRLTLATGGEQGNYYRIGQIYKRKLAAHGITVEVLPTQGSVENLTRLQRGEVDLAFVQSGIGSAETYPGLLGLGSLYFEPLWVFTRAPAAPELLRDLNGKRLAVGSEGSGTWAVTALLLAENGITADNSSLHRLSGESAAWALAAGDIDAMFVVAAPDAPLIKTLLSDPQVRLMDFRRAEAYARRHRFLSVLMLPRGTIDPANDLPAADTRLLAPAATLVARAG